MFVNITDDSLNITRELLKELRETKPIPPVLPVQSTEELTDNEVFLKYLTSRMNGLPKNIVENLQDEFLSAVKREQKKISDKKIT